MNDDPLDIALTRALQNRRASPAPDAPPFARLLRHAHNVLAERRRERRTMVLWAAAAAVLVAFGVLFFVSPDQPSQPSLASLMEEIAAEHQQLATPEFGRWHAPSDAFGPAFALTQNPRS